MLYLVTGGSGSGKSEYAESRLCELCKKNKSDRTYLATMIPYGKETEEKIKRHRKMRAEKNFQTEECFTNLVAFAQKMQCQNASNKETGLLLECMSNLVANELFDASGASTIIRNQHPEITEDELVEKLIEFITEGVRMLNAAYQNIVIVTNEVFSESMADSKEMSLYKKILGGINCKLAEMAKEVTEVVYGQRISYKKEKGITMDKHRVGMHFIIGGAYQGKLAYARQLYPQIQWADGENDSFEVIQNTEGIYHFESYINRALKNETWDVEEIVASILDRKENRVIVCNEIGYGLVPIDAFERYYREQVGRVCTELSRYADKVTRVVCGIGMELK